MPDWSIAALLGIIEGITEFIPVSSTGHLLLTENLLRIHESDLFNIVIQSGAVLAVVPLFRGRLRRFMFEWRERETRDYLLKIVMAFAITGMGGLVLDKKDFKLPESPAPVAWALFIGGILFLAVESRLSSKKLRDSITWPVVLAVAAGQLVAAVFPGSSRSGSTILLALLLGVSRPAATEFSFLVGIPTMLAAGGLKIFEAIRAQGPQAADWGIVFLSTAIAAVTSFVSVKWLLRYIQTHTFSLFGWYRIVLAGMIFLLLLI